MMIKNIITLKQKQINFVALVKLVFIRVCRGKVLDTRTLIMFKSLNIQWIMGEFWPLCVH